MQSSNDYFIGTDNDGNELWLPRQFISGRTTILAETGKGKTYIGKVLAEEVLNDGQHVVVIDPVGVWWGLRSNRIGLRNGSLPVFIIGGDHGDVPLTDPSQAVALADTIIALRLSVVIDLSHLETQADVTKFATLFAERLYRKHTGEPLLLIVDEADEFVPQKPNGVGENTMVNRWLRFWKRGRARGFGVLALTQRAASFSKEAITQSGTLILLGMTAKDDINAVIERVQVKAEGQLITDIKKWLPIANVGDAILWSPGALRRTVWFRARKLKTFDSSATPKIGERKVEAKLAGYEDLDKIKDALKLIAPEKVEYEQQFQLEPQIITEQVEVEVPVLSPDDIEAMKETRSYLKNVVLQLEKQETALADWRSDLQGKLDRLDQVLEKVNPGPILGGLVGQGLNTLFRDGKPRTEPVEVKVINLGDNGTAAVRDASERNFKADKPAFPVVDPRDRVGKQVAITGEVKIIQGDHKHRILGVLATFYSLQTAEVERDTVAALAGIGLKSSAYDKHLAELRAAGLINSNNGKLSLTPEGRQAAPPAERIGGLGQYQDAWRKVLIKDKRAGKPAVDVLNVLVMDGRPTTYSRENLARHADRSITSSAFENGISSLVRYGLASKPGPGEVRATDKLFPPTLTRRT